MKQYNVTGMSCAACSARVEKAVLKVPGVTACSVSLLTNSMGVEGTAAPQAVIAAVEAAGYGAAEKGGAVKQGQPSEAENALQDRETPALKRRLIWSVLVLLILMYFSMGHMMWGWPLPSFYDDNHVAVGLTQLVDQPRIGTMRFYSNPIRFDDELIPIQRGAPLLGQDTTEVLRGLGYTQEQIDKLYADGVVASSMT